MLQPCSAAEAAELKLACDPLDDGMRWLCRVVGPRPDGMVRVHYIGWSSRQDETLVCENASAPRGKRVLPSTPANTEEQERMLAQLRAAQVQLK